MRLAVSLLAAASFATQAAAAAGTLRVCASDLVNFDDRPRLDLPAGLVFAAWGPAPGDLRQVRLDPNDPPARATGAAAVVLAAPVQLTADAPCAVAVARALVSARHDWHAPVIAGGGDLVFTAVDTLSGDARRAGLYDLLAGNVLAASVASTIGDAETVP